METPLSSEVPSQRWAYYLPVGRYLTQSGPGWRGDISATRDLGGSEQPPNNSMNLPSQPVTVRACARPAPDCLAGYAERYAH